MPKHRVTLEIFYALSLNKIRPIKIKFRCLRRALVEILPITRVAVIILLFNYSHNPIIVKILSYNSTAAHCHRLSFVSSLIN